MSFWTRLGRWADGIFGGDGDRPGDVDPAKVEAAVRLIQGAVDDEQRVLNRRRCRVSELSPERQAELARELARLLKSQEVTGKVAQR